MNLIFGVTSCCIGILLIGLRELMRQRRSRQRQERLNRAIQEVVSNSGVAPERLEPKSFLRAPFFKTEESIEVISHRNRMSAIHPRRAS